MKITLTDRDGIQFDVDTEFITEVNGSDRADIILATGEKVKCEESALAIMQMLMAAKFGGAI